MTDLHTHLKASIALDLDTVGVDAEPFVEAFEKLGSRQFIRTIEKLLVASSAWHYHNRAASERGIMENGFARKLLDRVEVDSSRAPEETRAVEVAL